MHGLLFVGGDHLGDVFKRVVLRVHLRRTVAGAIDNMLLVEVGVDDGQGHLLFLLLTGGLAVLHDQLVGETGGVGPEVLLVVLLVLVVYVGVGVQSVDRRLSEYAGLEEGVLGVLL